MSEPKERPILFSGPMVRAIIDGRKTQTRRIIKYRDPRWEVSDDGLTGKAWPYWPDYVHGGELDDSDCICPYGQPGDRLRISEEVTVKPLCEDWFTVLYHADRALVERPCDPSLMQRIKDYKTGHLRGVSLPPAYARPDRLIITGVCVERLQDISEADAIAEGVELRGGKAGVFQSHKQAFAWLWHEINGPESWAANPWVWVVEFRKVEVTR
jgi:hypothetical protein